MRVSHIYPFKTDGSKMCFSTANRTIWLQYAMGKVYESIYVYKKQKQPTVLSSLASRWCLSEKKSHFRLSVWMSGFGSSDWLQSQPHITGLKTLWTSWTTNSLLCAEIKESNNTSKEGYDLPHHYSNGFFNVNSLICVCKTLCIYLLTGWQPEH